jgi:hypothetical protein
VRDLERVRGPIAKAARRSRASASDGPLGKLTSNVSTGCVR